MGAVGADVVDVGWVGTRGEMDKCFVGGSGCNLFNGKFTPRVFPKVD